MLTCRNQIYARTGALSGENKKEKEEKKNTPKTNPSILRTKPTVSPNRVNTTWISKSTALHFSSAIVNEGRGSAQRNSCQLRSAPGELLWAHRRLLGLWEPQLLEVFPQHLGTSSIRTALLGASKHCLGGFLQRKKEEKLPTVHACSPKGTRALVCKHTWGQMPWSQWKYSVTGNELQACLQRKAKGWGEPGQRCCLEPAWARWLRGQTELCPCAAGKNWGRLSYNRKRAVFLRYCI